MHLLDIGERLCRQFDVGGGDIGFDCPFVVAPMMTEVMKGFVRQ